MLKNRDLESLCEISTNVNAKEKKIWELQQHNICITKEIEKISMEIEYMRKRTQQLEEEDVELEALSAQLEKSIELQQSSIPIHNQITTYVNLYKQLLNELNLKFEDNCSTTINKYENDLNECRQNYEQQSLYYKQLHSEKVKLKQLQIRKMWLIAQINNYQKQQQLFKNIQKKKFQSTIIKLAQYCVNYRKYEQNFFKLHKLKEQAQVLLKEHLNLQETVKELSRKKIMKPQVAINNKRRCELDDYGDSAKFHNYYQEFSRKLDDFLSNDFEPNLSIPQTPQLRLFSNNREKVQILDVQILNASNKTNEVFQNKAIDIKSSNNKNDEGLKSNLSSTKNKPPKIEQSKVVERKLNELKPTNIASTSTSKLSQDEDKKKDLKEKSKEPVLVEFEQQLSKLTEKIESPKMIELDQPKFTTTPKRVSFKIDNNPEKSSSQNDTDNDDHHKSQSIQNLSISDGETELHRTESMFSFGRLNDKIFSSDKSAEKPNDHIFKYPLDDSENRNTGSSVPDDAPQGSSTDEDPFMFNASFGGPSENPSTSTNLPFSFGHPQKNIFQLF